MTRVLVADDDLHTRVFLMHMLTDAGYEVIEAKNGAEALDLACLEHPDILLLDVLMPVLDGFEVLRRLRKNPATEAIPVILPTTLPAAKGEPVGMSLGVTHYISKPWEPGIVEAAIRVALREAGAKAEAANVDRGSTVLKTGNMPLDQILSGGIPIGSLTLIEGSPSAGKSVLCQHILYETLIGGHSVAYFSPEHTVRSLITQMGFIGRDVSAYVRKGALAVYPLEEPSLSEDPGRLMASLATEIERLPGQYQVVTVDDITSLVSHSQETAAMGFMISCKRLCDNRRTIIVAARSYVFDEKMLGRLVELCDAHLRLRTGKIGKKLLKMLEVCKAQNAELSNGNTVSFEVVPGIGMQIVPGAKVRI